ncbi:hypothetical protein DK871_10720 [Pseudomonas sp. L13]|nr:hypothetical protein [Pseudomonas sp. L13]
MFCWCCCCSARYKRRGFVGASLLAKHLQAPRLFRTRALSLRFFASKLAPTIERQKKEAF